MSDYFSHWRARGYTCTECGWTGTGKEASQELFAELFELNCPQCDSRLDLISFPTEAEIQAAAESGHPEAQEMFTRRTKNIEGNP